MLTFAKNVFLAKLSKHKVAKLPCMEYERSLEFKRWLREVRKLVLKGKS